MVCCCRAEQSSRRTVPTRDADPTRIYRRVLAIPDPVRPFFPIPLLADTEQQHLSPHTKTAAQSSPLELVTSLRLRAAGRRIGQCELAFASRSGVAMSSGPDEAVRRGPPSSPIINHTKLPRSIANFFTPRGPVISAPLVGPIAQGAWRRGGGCSSTRGKGGCEIERRKDNNACPVLDP